MNIFNDYTILHKILLRQKRGGEGKGREGKEQERKNIRKINYKKLKES
jgi:hypothetical protein